MLSLGLKRSINLVTPWKFNQSRAIIPLQLITPETLYNELLSYLSEGFIYAYHSICDAYHNQHARLLEQCLEQRLFNRVVNNFNILEAQECFFEQISKNEPNVSLNNLKFSFGVSIDRSLNFPKPQYMMIKSLNEVKQFMPMDNIYNHLETEGVNANDSIIKSILEFSWVYASPSAPANLVISVDAVFESEAPLTIKSKGKDLIYKEKTREIHVFKFETESLNIGTQRELAMNSTQIYSIMDSIKKDPKKLFKNDWLITDIDNILLGNPYVSKDY